MRKYISLFFSVLPFFIACTDNKTSEGIIDHNRMISLLTEVHIADGNMYSVKQEPDSLYKFGTGQFLALFKKYRTNSLQFKKSMKYYADRPTELDGMYTQVIQNLKKKTDSLNKVQANINEEQRKLNVERQKLDKEKQKNALPQK